MVCFFITLVFLLFDFNNNITETVCGNIALFTGIILYAIKKNYK